MDRVCHFEIPYADKTRVEKFYRDVFGWEISDAPTEHPYSFAITTPVNEQFRPTEPGGINGGMYQRGEEGAGIFCSAIATVDKTDETRLRPWRTHGQTKGDRTVATKLNSR